MATSKVEKAVKAWKGQKLNSFVKSVTDKENVLM